MLTNLIIKIKCLYFNKWDIENCTILDCFLILWKNEFTTCFYTMLTYIVYGLIWLRCMHMSKMTQVFELHREITCASQTTLGVSVADFVGYLQSRWEELAQYEPFSEFSIEIASLVAKHLNRQHTYQFFMGLKHEFESIRNQILNSSPMP